MRAYTEKGGGTVANTGFTETDTGSIANAVASVRDDVGAISGVRDVLSQQVLSELEPYWQGAAKDAFTRQFTEFVTAFGEFTKGCEALNAELDKAGANYNGADEHVLQLIAGLP
jgi:WXG100 family type VII secretion target